MSEDTKEPVNFRLGRRYKRALAKLAAAQDKAVGELIREVVEAYVAEEERRAWEDEARRAASALAREAAQPSSSEAEMLRSLDENLDEFAREWVWEDEE
jgi:predicted DNA-binding protein